MNALRFFPGVAAAMADQCGSFSPSQFREAAE